MPGRCVTVSKLRDLARSSRDLSDTLEKFKKHNVQFVCLDPPIDTATPQGQCFVQVLAHIVTFERSLQSEKIHEGLDRARKRGVQLGRRPNGSTIGHKAPLLKSG
jgi:DNA invertase Pin-like site-specific DNA recombinase